MRFEWDEEKNRRNLLKHNIGFETAALAFDDPCALTQRDELMSSEERWITLGSAGSACSLSSIRCSRAMVRKASELFRLACDAACEENL
jgi:uncharacterized DUF497 family protein